MKYQLAIFDMDGTILNTLEDLTDAMNHALSVSGYPERTEAQVRSFLGNGIRRLVELSVPEHTPGDCIEKVFRIFNNHYAVHCSDKTKPYDGIKELLLSLRKNGVKTAVVSNKADYAVQELCARHFTGLFDVAMGEKTGIRKKPFPDMVNRVLERLDIKKESAVYIGDSEVDIQTATAVGMNSIIVDWGFRDRNQLISMGAEHIASSPEQVLGLLDN